jgi:hypothetical protein
LSLIANEKHVTVTNIHELDAFRIQTDQVLVEY